MGWGRIAPVVIAAALSAPAALAQAGEERKCANAEFDSRSELLDEFGPFAGASFKTGIASARTLPNCRIVTFYRVPEKLPEARTNAERRKILQDHVGKTAPPLIAARHVDDSRAGNYKPRWADQSNCPALVPALEKLEPLIAPKLVGDGPYRDVVTGGLGGQPYVRFWMTGQVYPQTDPDYTFEITIDGANSTPFGKWLDETLKALDGCWKPEPPVLP